jgi:superfamily II DNA/RNA helicase
MSQKSFAELGVSAAVTSALSARGFETAFPVQTLVLPDVLGGRDVLVKSPTGSGKTLAFGVPMVDLIEADDPRASALVLAPTRELALQIVDDILPLAHARALSVAAVYGGAGIEPQIKRARKAHIIVATPGRLEDLIERRAIKLGRVKMLVLDEADRMLDMGFRPPVDRIVSLLPRERQTLFFSATLDGNVGQVAKAYTQDAVTREHTPAPEKRGRITHRFVPVTHASKIDTLLRELDTDERDLALVFVRTKRGADRLVQRLGRQGVNAVAMHGNKTQSQREKALARFEAGKVDVLVATDVAARGLDVDGITHVINFDAPEDHEGFVHRTGRTARAGRDGFGITFVADDQIGDMHKIASALQLHAEFAASGLTPAKRRPEGRSPHQRGGAGPRGGNRNRNSRSNRSQRFSGSR